MKTLTINLYSFDELSEEAKVKALLDQIKFEIEVMDENSPFMEAAEEMERMQTPWFLGETMYHTPKYKEILIETIKANEYTFESNGEMRNA